MALGSCTAETKSLYENAVWETATRTDLKTTNQQENNTQEETNKSKQFNMASLYKNFFFLRQNEYKISADKIFDRINIL